MPSRLISGHPTTYSFSKQLAENLVKQYRKQIPVAIVRPTLGKSLSKSQNRKLQKKKANTV